MSTKLQTTLMEKLAHNQIQQRQIIPQGLPSITVLVTIVLIVFAALITKA